MLAEEIAAEFVIYMDEPDRTWVDDPRTAIWLERAYDDFRASVIGIDPQIYALSQTYSLSGVRRLDLDGTLLGAGAANRMYQLVNIYTIESTAQPDNVLALLEPAVALESAYDQRADYVLRGTELFFPGEVTMDIRVDYVPEPAINWNTAIVAGANVYVDDLNRFHDLIALIACLQYAVADVAENPQLLGLLGRRQDQLRSYLEGRSGGRLESVVDVGWM